MTERTYQAPWATGAFSRLLGASHAIRHQWPRIVWPSLFIALLIALWSIKYTLAINMTPSLPIHVAVIERGTWPTQVGELLAYRSTGYGPLPKGLVLIKRVVGMPGDSVRCDPVVSTTIQCEVVVRASTGLETRRPVRKFSRQARPLQAGPTGTIPDMHYHVAGDHEHSFDSRYALMGWIRADQVVGKVVWTW